MWEILHAIQSTEGRNLKELAISWIGRSSMDKHGSFWQTSGKPENDMKT
ncbi:hypothetical protein [Bartonella apihabitans]